MLSGSSPSSAIRDAAFDEGPGLAVGAHPEGLEPGEGEEGETVVELGDVDVGRPQVGPAPHLGGGLDRRHLRIVGPLEPTARTRRAADRLDAHGRCGQSAA